MNTGSSTANNEAVANDVENPIDVELPEEKSRRSNKSKDKLIPKMLPVCLSPQSLLPEKPLETPFAERGNDRASPSRPPGEIGLWNGHEVNSEFLGLLDCIAKKYPETFDNFTPNSKKLCTMKLNMLCTIVKDFTRTSMTEVDIEMITEYRAQFADLQRSFNVRWLVNRLNYIEQLQFPRPLLDKLDAIDSCIDDAKSKLQDLHALRVRTLTEIHMDIGTKENSLDIGYIGDDLLSGP
ncbi:hypothetical protein POM88_023255 [Heracleum sosnowskyi]|uniref:Uncharacterized protein n=1 Tax=Heracleum sosnowskyi TaxID=360622 RepID=A0AAD8IGY7_9APIA|nr:hypothetical protein POM88_023255 [Heracleum sosnowskyi]